MVLVKSEHKHLLILDFPDFQLHPVTAYIQFSLNVSCETCVH